MARKNDKKQVVSYENSIKKSNELSMAKLSHGLTLQQMQLLPMRSIQRSRTEKQNFAKLILKKIWYFSLSDRRCLQRFRPHFELENLNRGSRKH